MRRAVRGRLLVRDGGPARRRLRRRRGAGRRAPDQRDHLRRQRELRRLPRRDAALRRHRPGDLERQRATRSPRRLDRDDPRRRAGALRRAARAGRRDPRGRRPGRGDRRGRRARARRLHSGRAGRRLPALRHGRLQLPPRKGDHYRRGRDGDDARRASLPSGWRRSATTAIARERRSPTDEGRWYQRAARARLQLPADRHPQRARPLAAAASSSEFVARRNAIAERYRAALADVDALELPPAAPGGVAHAYHLFVVRHRDGAARPPRALRAACASAASSPRSTTCRSTGTPTTARLRLRARALPGGRALLRRLPLAAVLPGLPDADAGPGRSAPCARRLEPT